LYEDRQVYDEEAKAYYANIDRDKNKSVHLLNDENIELKVEPPKTNGLSTD